MDVVSTIPSWMFCASLLRLLSIAMDVDFAAAYFYIWISIVVIATCLFCVRISAIHIGRSFHEQSGSRDVVLRDAHRIMSLYVSLLQESGWVCWEST